jgi:hypothetical protein
MYMASFVDSHNNETIALASCSMATLVVLVLVSYMVKLPFSFPMANHGCEPQNAMAVTSPLFSLFASFSCYKMDIQTIKPLKIC